MLDVATVDGLRDQVAAAAPVQEAAPIRWRLATRIAFRLCVSYFGLYVISTQMLNGLLILPFGVDVPTLGNLESSRKALSWVATHVLRVRYQFLTTQTGSGDQTLDWVQAFCLVVIAVAATTAWSMVDRRRPNYVGLQKWFRLFLRFSLGATMIAYGAAKAIPLQMPAPSLNRLLEPYGNFSPMGVLWYSIGASRPYEIFAGCAELTAGVLLFVPRLATLGALVGLAVSIQIFTLNMTYDVPVKLFSFHLILMSLVLLAPEASRLVNVLILDRTAGPSTEPPLVRRRGACRILFAAQLVFGAYIVFMNVKGGREGWYTYGGGAPKSPLYGIWNVEDMSIDGVMRSPLITDYARWRRLTFQTPTDMSFWRMDDTYVRYSTTIDMNAKTIALTRGSDKNWEVFRFQRPDGERMILDGTMDGHAVHMKVRFFDPKKFLLVSHGFHWIQEAPFNR